MHLSATLLASILTLISAAPLAESNSNPAPTLSKRGCFSGGESWGVYQSNALSAAQSACSAGLGNNAVYNGNEQKGFCVNIGPNLKADFNIKRIKGSQRVLGNAECFDGLRKEIEGCGNGGRTGYENWEYTSDPNRGSC